MTVTFRAAGTWAAYTADGTVAIPASTASGDLMIALAVWKAFGTTLQITSPAGWTEITEFADGSVGSGNGTGSVKVAAFYKIHSGSETNPTLDWSVAPTPAAAVILSFQKSLGTWENPATFATAAIASATGWTATGSANLNLAAGDALLCLVGFPGGETTITRPTTALTATGITWTANYAEQPATHYTLGTNPQLAADAGYRLVSSGTSSAAPVSTGNTNATARTGAALFVRLRDVAGTAYTRSAASAASASITNVGVHGTKRSVAAAATSTSTATRVYGRTRSATASAVGTCTLAPLPYPAFDNTVGSGLVNTLSNTSATSQVITLPPNLLPGQMVMVIIRTTTGSAAVVDLPPRVLWPTSPAWTVVLSDESDASNDLMSAAYRIVTGTEGWNVATPTITLTISDALAFKAVSVSLRITGVSTPVAVAGPVLLVPGSADLDAPSLTPAAGSRPYLWWVVGAWDGLANYVDPQPTGYTNSFGSGTTGGATGTNARLIGAFRYATRATEDPPAWPIFAPFTGGMGWTLAIKGPAAYQRSAAAAAVSTITNVRIRGRKRAVAAAAVSTVTNVRRYGRTRAVSAAAVSSCIAVGIKTTGGTNYPRSAAASAVSSLTAVRRVGRKRLAASSATSTSSVVRKVGRKRIVSAAAVSTSTAPRRVARKRLASAAAVSTSSAVRLYGRKRSASAPATSSSTAVRRVARKRPAVGAAVSLVTNTYTKTGATFRSATITATSVSTAPRRVGRKRLAAAAAVSTITTVRIYGRKRTGSAAAVSTSTAVRKVGRKRLGSAAAVSLVTATYSAAGAAFRTATITATSSITNVRRYGRKRAALAAATSVSTAVRKVARKRLGTAAAVSTVTNVHSTGTARFRSAAAAAVSSVTNVRKLGRKRAALATATSSITHTRKLGRKRGALVQAVATVTLGAAGHGNPRSASAAAVSSSALAARRIGRKRVATAASVSSVASVRRRGWGRVAAAAVIATVLLPDYRLHTHRQFASAAVFQVTNAFSTVSTKKLGLEWVAEARARYSALLEADPRFDHETRVRARYSSPVRGTARFSGTLQSRARYSFVTHTQRDTG